MTPGHLRSLKEFEILYDRYQASPRKDSLMTKVLAIETYAIYAMGDFIILATIAHNRTSKDLSEICYHIYEDVKADMNSHFIFNTL
jgi:sulfur transfer complex TusBCD TusB component (DsrH family)